MKKCFALLLFFLCLNAVGQVSKAAHFDKIPSSILKRFVVEKDKFEDSFKIAQPTFSQKIKLSITIKQDIATLKLKTYYSGAKWIFYDKIIFLVDGERFEYAVPSTLRDVDSNATVFETSFFPVSDETLAMLRAIAKSKSKVAARFQGPNFYDDMILSKKIVQSLRETISLFDSLN